MQQFTLQFNEGWSGRDSRHQASGYANPNSPAAQICAEPCLDLSIAWGENRRRKSRPLAGARSANVRLMKVAGWPKSVLSSIRWTVRLNWVEHPPRPPVLLGDGWGPASAVRVTGRRPYEPTREVRRMRPYAANRLLLVDRSHLLEHLRRIVLGNHLKLQRHVRRFLPLGKSDACVQARLGLRDRVLERSCVNLAGDDRL